MLSRRTELRLRDIVEDSLRIERFIEGLTLNDFLADERTLFAVERLLQRITEAAIQIDVAEASLVGGGLPIREMRALGNRLRHEYRDIDPRIIFDLARVEVPVLRAAAQIALGADG